MTTEYQNAVARVVKHKCGGICFCTVMEDGKLRNGAQKSINEYSEPGYHIEDISIEHARSDKWCDCEK